MGYSTSFKKVLIFNSDLRSSDLAVVKKWLNKGESPFGYIDLVITDDFTGLKWNGAEKTYEMVATVNWLIDNIKLEIPAFGLDGMLLAQGESYEDRWTLTMVNNVADRKENPIIGQKVTCPLCSKEFTLEG